MQANYPGPISCTNPESGLRRYSGASAKIEDGQIGEIRFRAKGCVPAMACASAMTQLAEGKPVQQAREIRKADIVGAVGSLPPASGHAAQLAWDALQALLKMAP